MLRRRKKTKLDEKVLKEELDKHFRLLEYTFYTPEEYSNNGPEDLILGEEGEEDTNDELDIDLPDAEEPAPEDAAQEPDAEADAEADVEAPEADIEEPAMDTEPQEEEVEVDITDLIQGSQEAKASIDNLSGNMEKLFNMFQELSDKVNGVSAVTNKIEDLENEMEKRMPTEDEKLEMRSLDSYPYNLKLTDYWADKEGQYNVLDDKEEGEETEYVLTQKDVEDDYNEKEVKDSLTNIDYEEEEI